MNRSRSNKKRKVRAQQLSKLTLWQCPKCKEINEVSYHSAKHHMDFAWYDLVWFEQGHVKRSSNKGFG